MSATVKNLQSGLVHLLNTAGDESLCGTLKGYARWTIAREQFAEGIDNDGGPQDVTCHTCQRLMAEQDWRHIPR